MAKIKIGPFTRVTYDPENKSVRSFYNREGIEVNKDLSPQGVVEQFLHDYYEEFKFDLKELVLTESRDTSAYKSERYIQNVNKIPVYGASVVANVSKVSKKVVSFYNNFDYGIPNNYNTKPSTNEKEISELIKKRLNVVFEKISTKSVKLFIYRNRITSLRDAETSDTSLTSKQPDDRFLKIIKRLRIPFLKEEKLFLVWQVIVDVKEPLSTSLELLVDANTSNIILIRDLSDYVDGTGKVFYPDPVTTSENTSLSTSTPGSISPSSTFDPERQDVTLLGLDDADGAGNYHLSGDYCKIEESDPPPHPVPSESTPDFNYSTSDRDFLSVMVYYWIDTAQRYILNFLSISGAGDYQIPVDAQAEGGADNSHFIPSTGGTGSLTFGEGGAPDSSAGAVILHEYGHAIQHHQGFTGGSDLKEGFADLFARIYLDRYNPNQILREHVFPWDNNPNASYHWNPKRRLDLSESYSDSGYSSYDRYLKADTWATTVWQIYLALGGDSIYKNKRNLAAALVLKFHVEANALYGTVSSGSTTAYSNHQDMAIALEMASNGLNNWQSIPDGLFHKVIRDRCINRGLFAPLPVDVYIDDGRNGGYDFLQRFWNCEDLVVRRNSTDSPTMGHEQPILNQPNYLWAKVKRKGSGDLGTVNVKAFSCSPGTGLIWPVHWTATTPTSIPATTLGTSTEEWVGPFEFVPTEENHSCILAIVEAENDPANTETLVGNVSHGLLVPFDNNIAQRNLSPVSGGGGKQSRRFRVINSTNHFASISLDVQHDLPKAWKIDFDVPNIKDISLPPYGERWVTLRVDIPPDAEFQNRSERARVAIESLVDGIPDGGMTFDFVHPSLYNPVEKPQKIRVKVEQIQILNDHDPFLKGKGEFRFHARIKTDTITSPVEVKFPKQGAYSISDHPGKNIVKLNEVLYEGTVNEYLAIQVMGIEMDTFDPDDNLCSYKRIFTGKSDSWFGVMGPNDETIEPEDLGDWRIWYRIEKI